MVRDAPEFTAAIALIDGPARTARVTTRAGTAAGQLRRTPWVIDPNNARAPDIVAAAVRAHQAQAARSLGADAMLRAVDARSKRGLHAAALATPFRLGTGQQAVLIVLVGRARAFDPRAAQVLAQIATSVALAADFLGRIAGQDHTHESLKRFRAALDLCGDAIYITDRASMRFVDVNATACRQFGYSREQFLGITPDKVLGVDRESLARQYDEVIACGDAGIVHEVALTKPNGRSIVAELQRRAFPTPSGWMLVTIARDITKRKRTENALRESEARFRSLTELSSDWYWEQDAEFRYTLRAGRLDESAAVISPMRSASGAGSSAPTRSAPSAGRR